MLTFSFICTFLLLEKLVVNINKNPIVIYRSDIATKVTDIPFPAVTYCSALRPPEQFLNSSFLKSMIDREAIYLTDNQ